VTISLCVFHGRSKTASEISSFLFWSLLPTHCTRIGLVLHLITYDTHIHTLSLSLCRNPLDEGSARRRDLYPTTLNTHKRQTFISPSGFEPAIPASEWPQTHALDRAATGVSTLKYRTIKFCGSCHKTSLHTQATFVARELNRTISSTRNHQRF